MVNYYWSSISSCMRISLSKLLHEVVAGIRSANRDDVEDYFEYRDIVMDELFVEFNNDPDGIQSWKLVPFPRVFKIWNDFAKTGFVRDERGIDIIGDIVVNNIIKVDVNTWLAGHTNEDPEYELNERGYSDIDMEKLYDFITDQNGQLRISDFAMNDLGNDAILIISSKSPEEKLMLIDRAFNRIHQRSDIAGWFLPNGISDLIKLAGV